MSPPRKPGIYAIYLSRGTALQPYASPGECLYVGKSETNLDDRDLRTHFATGKSGHSTVRRSMGAILRDSLSLSALPRSEKRSIHDIRNFRFDEQGELRLTTWMMENLEIGYVAVRPEDGTVKAVEDMTIGTLKPPLNINSKHRSMNPYAQALMALRKASRNRLRG